MKIKILLASYNGEKYIEEQIRSILAQQNVEVDIMVRDDHSSDKTVALVKEHFSTLPLHINTPGTGSAAHNFLKMVEHLQFDASFEYVAFADQDDIWLPNKLAAAVEELTKHNASLYCSNLTKWDTSNGSYSLLKKDFPQKKYDYLFEGGSAGCTYVMTKDFAQQFQAFIQAMDFSDWKGLSHDWLVYFFARSKGYKVVIDPKPYILYRLHTENVHGHLNKLTWKTIVDKSSQVLNGYYQHHAEHLITALDKKSEEYNIYKLFLKNYFTRNYIVWKYNTQLMRDNKKFLVFALLNLIKF